MHYPQGTSNGATTPRATVSRFRPWLLALGIAALVALLVGGWVWIRTDALSRPNALEALPEAGLRAPGSSGALAEGKITRSENVLGTTSAQWWIILGTDASIDEVFEFYDASLTGRGWEGRSTGSTTSEIDAYQWTRPGLRFRLGFKDTEIWHPRLDESRRWATIYSLRIVETDPAPQGGSASV